MELTSKVYELDLIKRNCYRIIEGKGKIEVGKE